MNAIFLPRQARDKHPSGQKDYRFSYREELQAVISKAAASGAF
jgi:hypothetical protein